MIDQNDYETEDEYQEALERDYDDSDLRYDMARDDIGEQLYDELKAVFVRFYNSKGFSYYTGKDNLDKLKQHAISDINSFTPEILQR